MIGYLSLNIICSSKLTVFLEALSRRPVRLSKRIMSAHKYPSIFSRQIEAIVSIDIKSGLLLYLLLSCGRLGTKMVGTR